MRGIDAMPTCLAEASLASVLFYGLAGEDLGPQDPLAVLLAGLRADLGVLVDESEAKRSPMHRAIVSIARRVEVLEELRRRERDPALAEPSPLGSARASLRNAHHFLLEAKDSKSEKAHLDALDWTRHALGGAEEHLRRVKAGKARRRAEDLVRWIRNEIEATKGGA